MGPFSCPIHGSTGGILICSHLDTACRSGEPMAGIPTVVSTGTVTLCTTCHASYRKDYAEAIVVIHGSRFNEMVDDEFYDRADVGLTPMCGKCFALWEVKG